MAAKSTEEKILEKQEEIFEIQEKVLETLQKILIVVSTGLTIGKSLYESVPILKSAGLDNKTIALIFNTSAATVRAIESQIKAKERTK